MAQTTDLHLPPALVTAIAEQSAVLFLGAGASVGASHSSGEPIPSTDDLRDKLSDRFLGGKLKNRSLSHVAEMCVSETDMISVQGFVRDLFLPYAPASHHFMLPDFFWHAIVTTNYDLLVEQAYSKAAASKQELAIFYKDGQKIDTTLKSLVNGLPYLKLHGSIDRIDDADPSLILSKEQYARYSQKRKRLFSAFQHYGYEFPIIFCGYSIDDPHILQILFDLSDHSISRPRYYVVDPGLDEVEKRYWGNHRITCITATFQDFLVSLREVIPVEEIAVPRGIGGGTETVRSFYKVSGVSESDSLTTFLASDGDHVRAGMPTAGKTASEFYIGADPGWGPIEAGLDVVRRITDNIVVDAILTDENSRQRTVDLHVIKGPAGHGKTTTLRRVAWEASISFGKLCIYIKDEGSVRVDALRELLDLVQDRIYVFIDRAALRLEEVLQLINTFTATKTPLTVITAERDNEWNVRCGALEEHVVQEYPLRHLSERDIHVLLAKLEEHGALGRLEDLPYQERVHAFLDRAERQLLVALHEATLGKPFEEIIKDEFDRIVPAEAQTLYLDVCTLNRLGVPVRAGLISRVSGIRFEEFQEKFLGPLEHVVRSHEDRYVGDRMYTSRHAHIADLVFQKVLREPEERFDQVMRVLEGINLDYTSDNEAFRALSRGRMMSEVFASQELGRRFYEHCERIVGKEPHLLQQRGIFEMTHPGGSLDKAGEYLQSALAVAPYERSIQHTFANLKRRQANAANNPLLREKLRRDSRGYLAGLARGDARTPHGFHTMVLLLTDQLSDLLRQASETDGNALEERQIVDLTKEIEGLIRSAEQLFPENDMILSGEVRFRELLEQHGRALDALRRAFEKNARLDWIAVRLSQYLVNRGETEEGREVLERCLRENPASRATNFALAKLYMRHGNKEDKSKVLGLLKRSFSEGDSQFEAQFWYARELYLRGEMEESNALFRSLMEANIDVSARSKVRGMVRGDDGEVRRFRGTVSKKEESYCFVSVDGFPVDVFCYGAQASEDVWSELHRGAIVEVEVGFSMRGAVIARIRAV